jgi:hypothetical protein
VLNLELRELALCVSQLAICMAQLGVERQFCLQCCAERAGCNVDE